MVSSITVDRRPQPPPTLLTGSISDHVKKSSLPLHRLPYALQGFDIAHDIPRLIPPTRDDQAIFGVQIPKVDLLQLRFAERRRQFVNFLILLLSYRLLLHLVGFLYHSLFFRFHSRIFFHFRFLTLLLVFFF